MVRFTGWEAPAAQPMPLTKKLQGRLPDLRRCWQYLHDTMLSHPSKRAGTSESTQEPALPQDPSARTNHDERNHKRGNTHWKLRPSGH